MNVLVTGGNGLLATHIISQLLRGGATVRCTVRNKKKFRLPEHTLLEVVEGDITDAAFLERVTSGCDYIIHAAAQTPGIITDEKVFQHVNFTGTQHVMQAAVKHRIKKVIYVSTANTLGYGSANNPGHEASEFKAPFTYSIYAQTKHQAEQLVLSYRHQLEVVVVNPTFLLGPHIEETGSGQLLYRAYKKKVVFYPPGGKNIVHVEDVAIAIVKVLAKGRSGERYLLAGDNVSFRKFYQRAADINKNMAAILIPLPSFVLYVVGGIGSFFNWLGFKTNITYSNVSIFMIHNYYANAKAVNELGIVFRSCDDVLRDSLSWMEMRSTHGGDVRNMTSSGSSQPIY
jgi:dihydroflavonol-4-reductase